MLGYGYTLDTNDNVFQYFKCRATLCSPQRDLVQAAPLPQRAESPESTEEGPRVPRIQMEGAGEPAQRL